MAIHRPLGIVAGSINQGGQTAADIVNEIVQGAQELLAGASHYVQTSSKL